MTKKRVTMKQQITQMQTRVAHSNMLWLVVNRAILAVLQMRHLTVAQKVARLRKLAGRPKRGEAVSIGNFRLAARSLARGELITVT